MSMAPQKYSSVRHRARPAGMKPFRDDSLVAFRYEQTIQLEPPIPIPPRNPLRNVRPFSTISGCNTLIVVPPPLISPDEQHPALRGSHVAAGPSSPTMTVSDTSSKRDSGVAATSSSATIREEDNEHVVVVFPKLEEDLDLSTSCSPSSEDAARVALTGARCVTPPRTEAPEVQPPRTPPAPRSPTSPQPRKLVKSFSFRSGASMNRLRKKSLGEEFGEQRRSASDGSVSSRAPGTTSPKRAVKAKSAPSAAAAMPAAASGDGSCPETRSSAASDSDFCPLTIPIPTDSLLDDGFLAQLSFSKRGSIMLGGKRPLHELGFGLSQMESQDFDDGAGPSRSQAATSEPAAQSQPSTSEPATQSQPSTSEPATQSQPATSEPASQSTDPSATTGTGGTGRPRAATDTKRKGDGANIGQPMVSGLLTATPSIRILSAEAERESQKVRSLYESGDSFDGEEEEGEEEGRRQSPPPSGAERLELAATKDPSPPAGDENDAYDLPRNSENVMKFDMC